MSFRKWLLGKLKAVDATTFDKVIAEVSDKQFRTGHEIGRMEGERRARIKFAVLPLPFTSEQLQGREYGEFITPAGFGINAFGECNIPAPSMHGYEQRAYYVSKRSLEGDYRKTDMQCHALHKFDDPSDHTDTLVPVIVTVLR
jgi:hypothetical protein